jgi:hypothetical protein
MLNPYSTKPDTSFWRRSVTRMTTAIDPVLNPPFSIELADKVAAVGSCFAQHIARALLSFGYISLVTEPPLPEGASFPARFGNIYTVRQLLQLLMRAYGFFTPLESAWRKNDGRFVDPFRPTVYPAGFESVAEVEANRHDHLEAVRIMFESCDVFIFTLGLTEHWRSIVDGAVVPVVPHAVAVEFGDYEFHNATVAEMIDDLTRFITRLRLVNPNVRIVLTVSPVALIATYEDQHVVAANTYSKAALRVVAEETRRAFSNVAYFPSYEIIVSQQAGRRWYTEDLREVTEDGVNHVMSVFNAHYLVTSSTHHDMPPQSTVRSPLTPTDAEEAHTRFMQGIICDEELIDSSF